MNKSSGGVRFFQVMFSSFLAVILTMFIGCRSNRELGPAGPKTDGPWSASTLIETNNAGNARDPQVSMDEIGNAMVVWKQFDGSRFNIWANRYIAGTGWDVAELIETDNVGNAKDPQVATDGGGNAIVVWAQNDGTRDNIWANGYIAGAGWGTAELIETNNAGSAGYPQIAVDSDGNAVAVWRQSDGTRFNIWASRYVFGAGWGAAELIETDDAGSASDPHVSMDGSGNAIAVWEQSDGTRYSIRANRYAVGAGWGTAVLIATDSAGNALDPHVSMDGSGNAIAVWEQSDGSWYGIWANKYVVGMGWGTADLIAGLIERDDPDVLIDGADAHVAMNGSGYAIVVWQQSEWGWDSPYHIGSNRYVPGTGWGTAEILEMEGAWGAHDPHLAIDGTGDAIAVWSQSDGTRTNIWARRYVNGADWGTALLIETDDAGGASRPAIAMNGSGVATVVWEQFDGSRYNIWAKRYSE